MTLTTGERQIMQEHVHARLEELKKELETGQAELQKVEAQRAYLRETMLRIEGAMHALGELLAEEGSPEQNGVAPVGEQGATPRDEAGND